MDLHDAWQKWMANQRMLSDDAIEGESTTDEQKRKKAEAEAKAMQARSESLRRALVQGNDKPRWKFQTPT